MAFWSGHIPGAALVAARSEVVGTDISEQIVMAARRVAQAKRIADVRFERIDAEQYFSATVRLMRPVRVCARPRVGDGELFRVLKPGGRAIAAAPCGDCAISPGCQRYS